MSIFGPDQEVGHSRYSTLYKNISAFCCSWIHSTMPLVMHETKFWGVIQSNNGIITSQVVLPVFCRIWLWPTEMVIVLNVLIIYNRSNSSHSLGRHTTNQVQQQMKAGRSCQTCNSTLTHYLVWPTTWPVTVPCMRCRDSIFSMWYLWQPSQRDLPGLVGFRSCI